MLRTADDKAAAVIGATEDSLLVEFLFEFVIAFSIDAIIFGSFMDEEPMSELKNSGGMMFIVLRLDGIFALTEAIL